MYFDPVPYYVHLPIFTSLSAFVGWAVGRRQLMRSEARDSETHRQQRACWRAVELFHELKSQYLERPKEEYPLLRGRGFPQERYQAFTKIMRRPVTVPMRDSADADAVPNLSVMAGVDHAWIEDGQVFATFVVDDSVFPAWVRD